MGHAASMPRDVQVICAYSFLFHAGWCAWERSVMPVWIAVNSRDEVVGYVQSVQGVIAVAVAPLIGIGMDRARSLRPYAMLAVSSCVCALLGMAFCVRTTETGWPLYAANAAWAVALTAQGVLTDTTIAATSRSGEERAWAYALKATCWRAGAVAGQLMNALVFLALGDEWSARAMSVALYSGLVACGSTCLLLLLTFEQPTLEAGEEGAATAAASERLLKPPAKPEPSGG